MAVWAYSTQRMLYLVPRIAMTMEPSHNSIHQHTHGLNSCGMHQTTTCRGFAPSIGKFILHRLPENKQGPIHAVDVGVSIFGLLIKGKRAEWIADAVFHHLNESSIYDHSGFQILLRHSSDQFKKRGFGISIE